MKYKKKIIIVVSVIVCLAVIGISVGLLMQMPSSISDSISKLDKKYENLGEFKLESPFDMSVIDTYQIRSLSTSEHVGIDFFGKSGVTSIPFLAMIDGVVTHIKGHIMYNQDGHDNWAFEMWISINSQYMVLLNFETFGDKDDDKKLQEENIFVKEGDLIKKGQLIANLIICRESAHVHYSLKKENVPDEESFIVPEPYFSDTAMELINDVFLQRLH